MQAKGSLLLKADLRDETNKAWIISNLVVDRIHTNIRNYKGRFVQGEGEPAYSLLLVTQPDVVLSDPYCTAFLLLLFQTQIRPIDLPKVT
jgi:hypothetical protein